jgi:hypothetical protein
MGGAIGSRFVRLIGYDGGMLTPWRWAGLLMIAVGMSLMLSPVLLEAMAAAGIIILSGSMFIWKFGLRKSHWIWALIRTKPKSDNLRSWQKK